MTDFEPQRGKYVGHGIEVSFIRRFSGDRREDTLESIKVSGRPLVVIDPEDREAVERLRLALIAEDILDASWDESVIRAKVARALCDFANPKPPKPDEPMGLGAVVEDEDGNYWVRTEPDSGERVWDKPWLSAGIRKHWMIVDAVRVLSEGVSDA